MNLNELSKTVTKCRKENNKQKLLSAITTYAIQDTAVIKYPTHNGQNEIQKFIDQHFNLSTTAFIRNLRYKF